jgi:hypothetical protein
MYFFNFVMETSLIITVALIGVMAVIRMFR